MLVLPWLLNSKVVHSTVVSEILSALGGSHWIQRTWVSLGFEAKKPTFWKKLWLSDGEQQASSPSCATIANHRSLLSGPYCTRCAPLPPTISPMMVAEAKVSRSFSQEESSLGSLMSLAGGSIVQKALGKFLQFVLPSVPVPMPSVMLLLYLFDFISTSFSRLGYIINNFHISVSQSPSSTAAETKALRSAGRSDSGDPPTAAAGAQQKKWPKWRRSWNIKPIDHWLHDKRLGHSHHWPFPTWLQGSCCNQQFFIWCFQKCSSLATRIPFAEVESLSFSDMNVRECTAFGSKVYYNKSFNIFQPQSAGLITEIWDPSATASWTLSNNSFPTANGSSTFFRKASRVLSNCSNKATATALWRKDVSNHPTQTSPPQNKQTTYCEIIKNSFPPPPA